MGFAKIDALLDLGKYGIHPEPSKSRWQVTWVPAYQGQGVKRVIGVYPISQVDSLKFSPREIVLLILQPVPPHLWKIEERGSKIIIL